MAPKEWLTVTEVAAIEGVSTETIRRGIKAFKYPASRASDAPGAPWLINAAAYARQREIDDHKRRVREAGTIVGFGDFAENVKASDRPPETKAAILAVHDKHELFDRVERDMYEGPDAPALRQKFEGLDEEARFDAEARELAARVRRAERLRARALEILEKLEDED